MDAAENQQVMILWQVMQCPDDGIEPLVAPEKTENPDQPASRGDVVEHWESFPGRGAPNVCHLGGGQKR